MQTKHHILHIIARYIQKKQIARQTQVHQDKLLRSHRKLAAAHVIRLCLTIDGSPPTMFVALTMGEGGGARICARRYRQVPKIIVRSINKDVMVAMMTLCRTRKRFPITLSTSTTAISLVALKREENHLAPAPLEWCIFFCLRVLKVWCQKIQIYSKDLVAMTSALVAGPQSHMRKGVSSTKSDRLRQESDDIDALADHAGGSSGSLVGPRISM